MADEGDKQAGARFIEYAQVMKGKRQLFWSHGFKALVGIEDRTDEELVEEERDHSDCLGDRQSSLEADSGSADACPSP